MFGVRYRTIFSGLGIAAASLTILLMVSIPSAKTPTHGPVLEELLSQLRADWTRLLIIAVLLAVTASAGILTWYSYYAARDKLAKVRGTAKAILESLVGGVLTLDLEGQVTVINRAASEILEVRAEPPYPDLETITATHASLGGLIREALVQRRYVRDHDLSFVNSKNVRLVLRTTISEQRDETGRRAGIIVLVNDVSKLVAMEEDLRKQDRLAAAGTLAAGIAHEIRNPLSALELNLRLLRDEIAEYLPAREDIASYFEILSAETRRLNRITSNFLQLSRPEPMAKSLLCLREPLQRVVRLLETEAREKGICFELSLGPANAPVIGDATKLEQVCLNILINAMQAMPSGGVIGVSSRVVRNDSETHVNLVFTDQGAGIPPENLPRLFDPYFTTRSDGTGLGLTIANRIVTDHGGKILVESTVGAGTKVTLSFPLAEAGVTAREQESRT